MMMIMISLSQTAVEVWCFAAVRAEVHSEARRGDVQRRSTRHRSRLHHRLRRDRRRHRGDAPPRSLQTLRAASRRRSPGPPAPRPGRVARGTARGRDADDRLREPDVQVLRDVGRQRLSSATWLIGTNFTPPARLCMSVCLCTCCCRRNMNID